MRRAGLLLPAALAMAALAQLITPGLQFATGSLTFTATAGAAAAAQIVALTCLGNTGAFTASAVSNGGWLAVTPASGTTPATLTVSVHTAGLLPGTYTGSVNAVSAGACAAAPPLAITLIVNPAPGGAYTVSPPAISFSYAAGGPIPAPRTFTIAGGTGLPFSLSTSSSGGWFSVTPLRASPPVSVTVTPNPTALKSGNHKGEIIIAPSSGPLQRVPVAIVVTGGPAPVTEPVVFTWRPGDSLPAPRTVTVAAGPFLVSVAGEAGWLSATPYDPARPSTVSLSVDPAGLSIGSYSGTVMVSYPGGAVETVPVVLDVVSNQPRLSSIRNAASLGSSPLAPGEIITIRGTGIGPEIGEEMRPVAGFAPRELGGVRVLVNGIPAPVLYAQESQVNAVVPYGIARTTVSIEVEYQGRRSAPADFFVQDASPGIFTLDGSGRGQAALLNEDTSVNADLNPADRGHIAVLYATGAGLMTPPVTDGQIVGHPLSYPLLPVSVLVDGRDAEVIYAGSAPGLVAGVLQVNFRVPETARTGGAVGILLKIGRFTSQAGVTIGVR